MNKINLKTYFKKRKQRISVSGISTAFDWWLILGVTTLVFLCGAVYASYLYVQINNNSLFEVTDVQDPYQEIDSKKQKIKKVVDTINQRNFDESALN